MKKTIARLIHELKTLEWGATRGSGYADSLTPTDRRFTGQRWEGGTGLYHFNARWYDPLTGRFTRPDTIVPAQQGVQAWDRHSLAELFHFSNFPRNNLPTFSFTG